MTFAFFCRFLLVLQLVAVLTGTSAANAQNKNFLMAHRGVHQLFDRKDLKWNSCTANRIYKPHHTYLENTIASMRRAFELGADMVEFDIHPTTDGKFAVFHNWSLDCHTNGKGNTRKQSLSYLKTLDIGYGYTSDGGQTYPFRGKGEGLMPSLKEVLDIFPDKAFLINFKSNDQTEGDKLAAVLKKRPANQRAKLVVYGGEKPTMRLMGLLPDIRGFTKNSIKSCLIQYELYGWSGIMPENCKNTVLVIPLNYITYLWGWPEKLVTRMKQVNTQVIVAGPRKSGQPSGGINTPDMLRDLPTNYTGGIWTDAIDVIASEIRKKKP